MAKKLSLSIDYTAAYTLIGISSPLKDYRLTYYLNEALNFQLKKIDDLMIQISKENNANYSTYFFNCEDLQNTFCLLSNHHPEGKLITSLKQLDYFLLIQNHFNKDQKTVLIKALKTIPNLLAVFEIDLSTIKKIDNIIMDLEFHLPYIY